jgi:hypothetical protein
LSAAIIEFPKRPPGHDRGPYPGPERTVAEIIALRLVELDRDLAHAVYAVMWGGGRLFDEVGNALDQVLGPIKVEPSGPLTDAVLRAFDDEGDR